MNVDTMNMPRKILSSFAGALSSHGDTTGMIRYRLMRGYMNHRWPAIDGKLNGSLLRSASDCSHCIPPHSRGRKV